MTTENITLDTIDLIILEKFSADSTYTNKQLQKVTQRSEAFISSRVSRLRDNGYIFTFKSNHLKMLTLKGTEALNGNLHSGDSTRLESDI